MNLPIIAIVGRPNVGKSTLFNRIVGKRVAVVAREAGTTRDRVIESASWNGKDFLLCDTAGLLVDFYGFKEEEIERKAQEQIDLALQEADEVLFVVDAKAGIMPEDKEVARKIRKFSKKTIVVANKADSEPIEKMALQVFELGFEKIIAVSALTGRRSGDLLDAMVENFKPVKAAENKVPKLTIAGRPNVGKSTLFNTFVGDERAIVSETAGTTRDSIKLSVELTYHKTKKTFEIIDTAGFKKRGKVAPGIEKFSVLRSIQNILNADIVLLMADSAEGFTRGDAHLGQLAITAGKKLIIVLNKIDLLEMQTKNEINNLGRFQFLTKIPMVAISALDKQNIDLLTKEILGTI